MALSIKDKLKAKLAEKHGDQAGETLAKWWMNFFMKAHYVQGELDLSRYPIVEWDQATRCLYAGPQTAVSFRGFPIQIRYGQIVDEIDLMRQLRAEGRTIYPLDNRPILDQGEAYGAQRSGQDRLSPPPMRTVRRDSAKRIHGGPSDDPHGGSARSLSEPAPG